MMLIGLGLAGIAIIVAAGIGCWKMLATNKETSQDEPLIDEPSIHWFHWDDDDDDEDLVFYPVQGVSRFVMERRRG